VARRAASRRHGLAADGIAAASSICPPSSRLTLTCWRVARARPAPSSRRKITNIHGGLGGAVGRKPWPPVCPARWSLSAWKDTFRRFCREPEELAYAFEISAPFIAAAARRVLKRKKSWSRFSLAGRNAVVTGGSRGIGAAIAIGLAQAGADVLITYRERHEDPQKIVKHIEGLGRRAHAVPMDVTDRLRIAHAALQARALGPISILVNNAGINKPTDSTRSPMPTGT